MLINVASLKLATNEIINPLAKEGRKEGRKEGPDRDIFVHIYLRGEG